MGVTKPTTETWLSAYQAVQFGLNVKTDGYVWAFSNVQNVNGKAAFENDIATNTYTTPPPSKYFVTPTGIYAGTVHVITSIGTDGTIYTNTDFIDDDDRLDSVVLPNLIYRIYYGYPTPTSGSYVDIKPIWKVTSTTATLVVDIQEFLQELFTIEPPVAGFDDNMYEYIQIKIKGAADFETWATDNSLTIQDLIDAFTSYDFTDFIWYVINGTVPHTEFNSDYTGASDLVTDEVPVYFTGHPTIVSKIVNDPGTGVPRVYNIIT